MKISQSRILLMFCLAIGIGIAADRVIAKEENWSNKSLDSKALMVYNLAGENEIASEDLVNKWLNIQGELKDIQIDDHGEIVLKINTQIQSKSLSCFFSNHIKSKELDLLYSNKKVQLTGLCKRVGNKIILIDCELI